MPKVLEESWDLVSSDAIAIPSSGRHDGGANARWSDIWEYQVPSGQVHILKPGHHFSVYLDDTSGEVSPGQGRVRIVVKDQSKQGEKTIFGPTVYEACKNFNDEAKMARLNLTSDLVVEERFWIVIIGYTNETMDESDSFFSLQTIRVRSGI